MAQKGTPVTAANQHLFCKNVQCNNGSPGRPRPGYSGCCSWPCEQAVARQEAAARVGDRGIPQRLIPRNPTSRALQTIAQEQYDAAHRKAEQAREDAVEANRLRRLAAPNVPDTPVKQSIRQRPNKPDRPAAKMHARTSHSDKYWNGTTAWRPQDSGREDAAETEDRVNRLVDVWVRRAKIAFWLFAGGYCLAKGLPVLLAPK